MELFSKEFDMDLILANQVHKMALYIALWHGPKFLKCSLAATAPADDLTYFYNMQALAEMDDPDFSKIGVQVSASIQRHTSYLKPSQVIFALFDENSSPQERHSIASALSNIPRPDCSPNYFRPGKVADVPLVGTIKGVCWIFPVNE